LKCHNFSQHFLWEKFQSVSLFFLMFHFGKKKFTMFLKFHFSKALFFFWKENHVISHCLRLIFFHFDVNVSLWIVLTEMLMWCWTWGSSLRVGGFLNWWSEKLFKQHVTWSPCCGCIHDSWRIRLSSGLSTGMGRSYCGVTRRIARSSQINE